MAEGKVLTAKDLLIDPSGYVEVGDVKAAMSVTELLGGRRRSFDLRIGPDLAFEDLHGAPTVLVGGYANFWTMFMNRDLHFYFVLGVGCGQGEFLHGRALLIVLNALTE